MNTTSNAEVQNESIIKKESTVDKQKVAETKTIENNMTVYFLDVGQGNAVLVENDGLYMLIDGGDREYSSFVVSYLKQVGVEKLDYVIASHYDADHLNGVVGALNVFDIGIVLDADYITDTRVYQSFIAKMKDGINEVHPNIGDQYSLGDAEITVVSPVNYDYSDVNDDSVGIRIKHGNNSFLICGDAGQNSEEDMIATEETLQSTVYMVNHHGSSSSSTNTFLNAVNPSYAIISSGKGNNYGHPHEETMYQLKERGIQFFRTDEQGTIIAYSDGNTITWNVDPSNDYSSGNEINDVEVEIKKTDNKTTDKDDNLVPKDTTYIINTNTNKFHLIDCSSVQDMSEHNIDETTKTREELIGDGYSPCGRCNP